MHAQDIIVYLIVVAAIGYLVRLVWLTSKGKKGCHCGTGGCGAKKAAPGPQLVQISLGPSLNGSAPPKRDVGDKPITGK